MALNGLKSDDGIFCKSSKLKMIATCQDLNPSNYPRVAVQVAAIQMMQLCAM